MFFVTSQNRQAAPALEENIQEKGTKLTQEQIASYNEKGYLGVEGVGPIALIRSALDDPVRRPDLF